MSVDQLQLEVLTERSVIRNDEPSEIDVAIDLITSRSIDTETARYALNLCIVIDRSASMQGDKLEQAKRSCADIYESLNPNDLLTILAFDSNVLRVVNPQTPRDTVVERIMSLSAGDSTNLSNGWYLGLLELQTYTTDQHINRLVLLSDGMANEGEQKPSVLGAESGRARDQLSITTSTIGVGKEFQEDILAALAHESGGRFWFIGEAKIEDIIKEEFSGALSVYLERPRIEIDLPEGVEIVKELNELPKTSNRYRVRPIKANDQFSFAFRLHIDPAKVKPDECMIVATLYDGAGIVKRTENVLNLGSVEDYVKSAEDPRVSMIVTKFLVSASDELITEKIDTGDLTTMLEMLQSQSNIMNELETKLSGVSVMSWDDMTDRDRKRLEEQLNQLRMEMGENDAVIVITELVDLMSGLGQTNIAVQLISEARITLMNEARMLHRHRYERSFNWNDRGGTDDAVITELLKSASIQAQKLVIDYPDLSIELQNIQRKIDELLEKFS